MNQITDTLAKLGKHVSLESIELGDNGACHLIFDDEVSRAYPKTLLK